MHYDKVLEWSNSVGFNGPPMSGQIQWKTVTVTACTSYATSPMTTLDTETDIKLNTFFIFLFVSLKATVKLDLSVAILQVAITSSS